ncbi:hypothetical protein [Corallococcus sicarius]|uniref:hypothetical protein n=1 Tax=Corallococcus sicarius TaxID=2316726 RepID=UPI0011C42019|nr:hypothetical protein [Corallococcus sicarius]
MRAIMGALWAVGLLVGCGAGAPDGDVACAETGTCGGQGGDAVSSTEQGVWIRIDCGCGGYRCSGEEAYCRAYCASMCH